MSAAPFPFTLEAATALLPITEAAALAQLEAPDAADDEGEAEEREAAAVLAMHQALLAAGLGGRLVAGKGLGRVLGRLYTGEELPVPPGGRALDLAVDPLEGTSYRPPPGERGGGAVAVLAAVPAAGFLDPGPFFYMDKLVAPPAAAGRVDPAAPLPERLSALAAALGKAVPDLAVAVLEKPRHRPLLAALERAGVQPRLFPAGDVVLALQAALPEGPLDALMGTGGAGEGLMAAAAARALGALFHWRFDPQLPSEKRAAAAAGLETRRWRTLEELAAPAESLFIATGIRDGDWLSGVARGPGWLATESFLLTGPGGERHRLRRVRPWPPPLGREGAAP